MKERIFRFAVFVFGVFLTGGSASAGELQFNGFLGTENYLGLEEGEFYDFRNANWLRLKLKALPAEQAMAQADVELRNTNFTGVKLLDDLWDRSRVEPVGWRINEAWLEFSGFLFDSEALTLDLRAGKQVLGWGEADGFNPTNYFDVYDLENPLDFKKRIGNVALRATFSIASEAVVLEAVLAPRFLPSVLPVPLFLGHDPLHSPLMPPLPKDMLELIQALGLDLAPPANSSLVAVPPEFTASEMMAGGRVRFSLAGVDVSLVGFHGRDNVPALREGTLTFADAASGRCPQAGRSCLVVEQVRLAYPKLDLFGLDFRADVFGVGLWGEAALVFPRRQDAVFWYSGSELARLKVIEDTPFTKWTVGAEYTFVGGWYFNLQWVHGFFTEQTGHQLHDYLFLVMRKSVLYDRLQFELSLGGELDHSQGGRALGAVGSAEISYRPVDGARLSLGAAKAWGEEGTRLSLFEELTQVFLKLEVGF